MNQMTNLLDRIKALEEALKHAGKQMMSLSTEDLGRDDERRRFTLEQWAKDYPLTYSPIVNALSTPITQADLDEYVMSVVNDNERLSQLRNKQAIKAVIESAPDFTLKDSKE